MLRRVPISSTIVASSTASCVAASASSSILTRGIVGRKTTTTTAALAFVSSSNLSVTKRFCASSATINNNQQQQQRDDKTTPTSSTSKEDLSSTSSSLNTSAPSNNNSNDNDNNSNNNLNSQQQNENSSSEQQQQQQYHHQEEGETRRVQDSSGRKLVERIEHKPGFFAKYKRWFIIGGAASGAFFWITFDYFNDDVLSRCARFLVSMATVLSMYKFRTPESAQDISDMNTRAAKTLLFLCQANEGLYIKMGQQIHSLNQVLPPEYSKIMKVLLDGAPDVDVSKIRQIVKEDLGQSVDELFVEWDEKPIASASIAQVHKAKIRIADGSIHEVAVKVQKPNIKKQMWWDLQCYFLFCWCVNKGFGLPVWWSAQHIAEKLSMEIDFRKEADHINYARSLLLSHPDETGETAGDVYVPKVYTEALSARVLCTEWIDSVKLHEKEKVEEYFDVPGVMTSLVRSFADLVFDHGFLHADPHPANVLVRPHPRLNKKMSEVLQQEEQQHRGGENSVVSPSKNRHQKQKFNANEHQIVYIDWGLAQKEDDTFKRQYAQLFKAIFMRDEKQITDIVSGWGISDSHLFASMMMQKPISFEKNDIPLHKSAVTKEKVLEMQKAMKEKASSLLEDESKTPKELILLPRGMNLIRSVNKSFNAPVNRVNILAERAARSLGSSTNVKHHQSFASHISRYAAEMRFHMSLAWLSFMFHFLNWYSQTIQWLSLTFVGKEMKPTANLETILEDMEKNAIQAVTGQTTTNEYAPQIDAND